MSRIFKYELKRLIINKFFLGLVIISALCSHEIMRGDIILGISNTAPFSGWSYGEYIAKVLPILLVTLLFFISFLYSRKEKSVQVITKAAQINQFKFRIFRYIIIIIGFALISAVPIGYSMFFYAFNFHFTNFKSFILPTTITLIPAMLFVFGLGSLLGHYREEIVFLLMAAVILVSFFPLPYVIDLSGANFFKEYPVSLSVVEPAFFVPINVMTGKVIYGITGLGMMLISAFYSKK